MAAEGFVESSPLDNLGVWTAATGAYADGGGYASTQTNSTDCRYMDFNLDGLLPSSCEIVGIRVRVDGYWHDTTGGSLISKCGVRVDLSWDGGTSWSDFIPCKGFEEDNEKTFYAGGPSEDWGHTWTRAQITSDVDFEVRIRSIGAFIVDTPEWRVDFIQVAVYYNDTTPITVEAWETLEVSDSKPVTSHLQVRAWEHLRVHDSGSGGTEESIPSINNVTFGGEAITEIASSNKTDFFSSCDGDRIEGALVWISFGAIGPSFWISDAQTAYSSSANSLVRRAQPGLIKLVATKSASWGQTTNPMTADVSIANVPYSYYQDSSVKTMSEFLYGRTGYGGRIAIYALAKGDDYYQRLVFKGSITELQFNETTIDISATMFAHTSLAVPDQTIDIKSFYYKGTSYPTAGIEGRVIEDTQGDVIPIGLGRFDITATNLYYDTGHPYWGSAPDNRDEQRTSVYSGTHGIKYPMLPIVAAIRDWQGPNDIITNNQVYSPPKQIIFLYGNRNGGWSLTWPTTGDLTNPLQGCTFDPTPSKLALENNYGYNVVCTWVKDETYGIDSAAFFNREFSERVELADPTGPNVNSAFYQWLSAGHVDTALAATGKPGTMTLGTAQSAYGVFVNIDVSKAMSVQSVKYYPLSLQSVMVPFSSVVYSGGSTTPYQGGTPFNFSTSASVDNVENAIDYRDYSADPTLIDAGEKVVYAVIPKMPSVGKLYGVRVVGLLNYSQTTGEPLLRMNYRHSGPTNGLIGPGVQWNYYGSSEIHNIPTSAAYMHSGYQTFISPSLQQAHVTLIGPGQKNEFSFWVLAPWIHCPPFGAYGWTVTDPAGGTVGHFPYPFVQPDKGLTNIGFKNMAAMTEEWEFMTWGNESDGVPNPVKWPWVFSFWTDSGTVALQKVWLEAVYVSGHVKRTNPTGLMVAGTGLRSRSKRYDHMRQVRPGSGTLERSNWYAHRQGYMDSQAPLGSVPTTVYLVGRTGNIERPSDLAEELIRVYCGSFVYGRRAYGADVFGSFDDAHDNETFSSVDGTRTMRQTLIVDRQSTLGETLGKICEGAMAIIDEQMADDADYSFRMFYDIGTTYVNPTTITGGPSSTDPARLYDTDGHYFTPDEMFQDSVSVSMTPISSICNSLKVQYGWHHPSGQYAYQISINKSAATLGGSLTAGDSYVYRKAAETSYVNNNVENPKEYKLEWVWDHNVARRVAKYLFSTQYKRRVRVEFTTSLKFCDLQVGHVIRFDDSMGDLFKYPGQEGSSNWSDHQFNVLGVSISKDTDLPFGVKIFAEEVFTWAHFP